MGKRMQAPVEDKHKYPSRSGDPHAAEGGLLEEEDLLLQEEDLLLQEEEDLLLLEE